MDDQSIGNENTANGFSDSVCVNAEDVSLRDDQSVGNENAANGLSDSVRVNAEDVPSLSANGPINPPAIASTNSYPGSVAAVNESNSRTISVPVDFRRFSPYTGFQPINRARIWDVGLSNRASFSSGTSSASREVENINFGEATPAFRSTVFEKPHDRAPLRGNNINAAQLVDSSHVVLEENGSEEHGPLERSSLTKQMLRQSKPSCFVPVKQKAEEEDVPEGVPLKRSKKIDPAKHLQMLNTIAQQKVEVDYPPLVNTLRVKTPPLFSAHLGPTPVRTKSEEALVQIEDGHLCNLEWIDTVCERPAEEETIPEQVEEPRPTMKSRMKAAKKFVKQQIFEHTIITPSEVRPRKHGDLNTILPSGEDYIQINDFTENGATYFIRRYRRLGKGGGGTVFKGYAFEDGKLSHVAIKVMRITPEIKFIEDDELGYIPSEAYFMKLLSGNKRALKFLHYQRTNNAFCIVMELPKKVSDIFKYMERKKRTFSEVAAWDILQQLVKIVSDLEKNNIAHRDIKVENILYNQHTGRIKLIDFGYTKYYVPGEKHSLSEFCGTLINAPPELYLTHEYELEKEAVRSIGVVLYHLLHRLPAYDEVSHVHVRLPYLYGHLSDSAKDLLNGLFALDPEERLTLAQIREHPWMQGSRKARLSAGFKRCKSRLKSVFRRREM